MEPDNVAHCTAGQLPIFVGLKWTRYGNACNFNYNGALHGANEFHTKYQTHRS